MDNPYVQRDELTHKLAKSTEELNVVKHQLEQLQAQIEHSVDMFFGTDAPCAVVNAVRKDMLNRSITGLKKYGTTLSDNPAGARERLQHLYEELMDGAAYVKWQLMHMDGEL